MKSRFKGKLTCPIHQLALSQPTAIAVSNGSIHYTYKQVDQLIASTASNLIEKGASPKDRIGLLLSPSIDYIAIFFALFRIQCIGVAINTRFPIETIPDLLHNVGCEFLIAHESLIKGHVWEEIEYASVQEVIGDSRTPSDLFTSTIHKDQPATVVFSSGSTGTPKAVLHSFGNHYYSALGSNQNIPISQGDRWLLSLPLYHVAGIAILFRVFISGGTVVISSVGETIVDSLIKMDVTHVSVVPAQLQRIIEANTKFPTLNAILVGGSSVNETLRLLSKKNELPVFFSYGMSEMSSQVTTTMLDATLAEIYTSGRLLPYREIKVTNNDEIMVKGDTLFLGYLSKEGIDLPLDKEGWFYTGDLGVIDQNGLLSILGRKDNMFISGGENIYPEHIEKAIRLYPGIRSVMVVPVSDPTFGKRPVAFIEVDNVDQVIEDLGLFLNDKLARYMHPIRYFDWTHAPELVGIKHSRLQFTNRAEELINQRSASNSFQ